MRRSLFIVLVFLAACAQREPLLFDKHYDSLCGIYSDLTHYAVDIHYNQSQSNYRKLQTEAMKHYAKDIEYDEQLPGTDNCEDIEALSQAQPDKNPTLVYSEAASHFMQTMDPHSDYAPQIHVESIQKSYQNFTVDTGIEFKYIHKLVRGTLPIDHLIVDYVYPDTDAYGKIRPDDEVLTINGVEIQGKTLNDINAEILKDKKNKDKKSVTLTTKRHSNPVTLALKPYNKPLLYSKYVTLSGKNFRVIRIQRILPGVSEAVKQELLSLNEENSDGVILDLRGNPGGRMREAIRILQLFLPSDEEIYYTEGNGYKHNFDHLSSEKYNLNDSAIYNRGLAVLVDSDTASAAEIMAGILQRRGVGVFGNNTFGKATMQIPQDVSPKNGMGGILSVTVGMGYYADNTTHQGGGVNPSLTLLDERMQLASTILKEKHTNPIFHEKDYYNALRPNVKTKNTRPVTLQASSGATAELLDNDYYLQPCSKVTYETCAENFASQFLVNLSQ
jgi:C-terminal peptidase prc